MYHVNEQDDMLTLYLSPHHQVPIHPAAASARFSRFCDLGHKGVLVEVMWGRRQ